MQPTSRVHPFCCEMSLSPGYLHWSSVYSALFSDAYEENDEFFWSVEFVSSGTVRLKNVKEGTYLASDGSTLSLESTGSAAGLWKYATVDESVTLQHSSSSKYLCTDAFPGLSDSCQSRSWTVTFLANTVSASVFTSVTVTTTSLTSTTRTFPWAVGQGQRTSGPVCDVSPWIPEPEPMGL